MRAIQTASRQYCHRQLTWARGLPLFSWVDADQGQEAVVEQILAELRSADHTGAPHFPVGAASQTPAPRSNV